MIRIFKTDIQIDVRTTPAKLSISQPKADFEMTRKDPKVIIKSEQIQVRIDQRQCFNESGLKDYATLSKECAEAGKRAALEGISRRANEGNMLSDIATGGSAIAQIAANKSSRRHVFDIVSMPMSRPVIDFIGGNVDIRIEEGYIDLKSAPNKPVIDVEVGGIDISIRQYPDISFQYVI